MSRRTNGFRVIRWIETFCVHTNGEWIGKPFRLFDWQKRLILELFELEADDLRRYRWALIGVPKKNGKTELAAALALYFLIGDDEPSPLVVCAAASDEQADLVFDAAKTMAKLSPLLAAITEPFDKEIQVPSIPGARLVRVAAVAGTNDGKNISALVLDELHEWVGRKYENVWNVLTNGSGVRRQPMILQITTAGHDKDTVCGRQYEYGQKVRNGELTDRRFFFHWVEAAPTDDHRDERTWKKSNPSYGILVQKSFFEDQLSKKTEAVFRRYFCNQWTQTEEIWIPYGVWDQLRSDDGFDVDLPVHVGIDVGLTHDSSAVALAQRQDDRTILRCHVWENPYPHGDARHDGWKLNLAEVENLLVEIFDLYPVPATKVDDEVRPGPSFNYDPHFFERSAQDLEGEGLTMVKFPQSDAYMIPASQTFFDLIVEGKIAHDGNTALGRHVHNAIALEKRRGWRIDKPKSSKKKIDAAIAAAIAVYRAQEPVPEVPPTKSKTVVGF